MATKRMRRNKREEYIEEEGARVMLSPLVTNRVQALMKSPELDLQGFDEVMGYLMRIAMEANYLVHFIIDNADEEFYRER